MGVFGIKCNCDERTDLSFLKQFELDWLLITATTLTPEFTWSWTV